MKTPLHITSLLFFAALVLLTSCSDNKVKLSGTVQGGEQSVLILERLDVNRTSFVDSIQVNAAGKFSLKVPLDYPELFVLSDTSGQLINLLLAPGDEVEVHARAKNFHQGYEILGSQESENIRILVEHLQQTRLTQDSLRNLTRELDEDDPESFQAIQRAYAQSIIKQKRFTIAYLVEHMSALSSVYALYQKYDDGRMVMGDPIDLQYFKAVADSVSLTHPLSSLSKSLEADIQRREREIEQSQQLEELLENAEIQESGLINLSIPDRDGQEVALASFQGKVVMVLFWSSLDENSIKVLLQLQPTYEKYHSRGFEIYAIALDNNKAQWMSAIDFNEFNWTNVCELSYPDSRAARLYNVSSIPTSFLINRQGEIMARNLYGKTLETWLDNLI